MKVRYNTAMHLPKRANPDRASRGPLARFAIARRSGGAPQLKRITLCSDRPGSAHTQDPGLDMHCSLPVIALLLVAGCREDQQHFDSAGAARSDGTSALLREVLRQQPGTEDRLLATEVASCDLTVRPPPGDPSTREALEDCSHRTTADRSWSPEEVAGLGYRLVSLDSVRASGPDPLRWPAVRVVSRPGFSRDGGIAVIANGTSCGMLCGSSSIMRYRRTDSSWTVDSLLEAMIY